MTSLETLSIFLHSSHEVKLDKDLYTMVECAVAVADLKTLRLIFSKKSMATDSHVIGALLHYHDDAFGIKAGYFLIGNGSDWVFEWSDKDGKALELWEDAEKPRRDYQLEYYNAFLTDRLPIMGVLALHPHDPTDERLVDFPDPDGDDPLAGGLKVLIPRPLTPPNDDRVVDFPDPDSNDPLAGGLKVLIPRPLTPPIDDRTKKETRMERFREVRQRVARPLVAVGGRLRERRFAIVLRRLEICLGAESRSWSLSTVRSDTSTCLGMRMSEWVGNRGSSCSLT